MDRLRDGIKTWLEIQPAPAQKIILQEVLDFYGNAIKNRIWYRGDSEELSEFYKSILVDNTKFWKANSTEGMQIRKIHVGIPNIVVDTLSNVTIADLNEIQLSDMSEEWEEIAEDNKFLELIEKAIQEALIVGDGAFKISFNPDVSKYPILEFYPGDKIEINMQYGRTEEIVFKTKYIHKNQTYILNEKYKKNAIEYELKKDDRVCALDTIPSTANLQDVHWQENFVMAVPFKIFNSAKWIGRGKSIFDGKTDAFDSIDEAWSQWMDALRANRTKEYIPESMLPRNPETGEILKPNAFDNRYIKVDTPMNEGNQDKILLDNPTIQHESYLNTYITALDLCLQGLISPSTLGIDVKKLDNAESQREKEKATLYTRNKIVTALQNTLPLLINNTLKAYCAYNMQEVKDIDVEVPFGQYANPSFESQVETVAKARTAGIMSLEAAVEELYGSSKDEEWKEEEVKRLREEQGITELEEMSLVDAEKYNTDNALY